jgi:hypothetical protein
MKSDTIVRPGDVVEIVNPEFFVRAGYPLTLKKAEKYVQENYAHEINNFMDSVQKPVNARQMKTTFGKIVNGLAINHLYTKKFGGNKRKIYTEKKPSLKGKEATVNKVKMVQTGTRKIFQHEWKGEITGSHVELVSRKTHKILFVSIWWWDSWEEDHKEEFFKIETTNVKKVRTITGWPNCQSLRAYSQKDIIGGKDSWQDVIGTKKSECSYLVTGENSSKWESRKCASLQEAENYKYNLEAEGCKVTIEEIMGG